MEGLVAQGLQKWFKHRKVVDHVSARHPPRRGGRAARAQRRGQDHVVLHDRRPAADGRWPHLPGRARRSRRCPCISAVAWAWDTCRRSRRYSGSSPWRRTCWRSWRRWTSAPPSGEERARELLAELDLTALAPYPAYTLSGGERRRLEITRALVTGPQYLLLDEPFTGIDPIAIADIQEIIARLRERGIGILITDHNVRETLAITDRAYILYDGKILVSGTASEIASNPIAREIYLGEKFAL